MTASQQSLSEMYICECNALQQKPNSYVVKYLHSEALKSAPEAITQLDFSKTYLGRKGVLPLLSVIQRCVMLRHVNLNETGLTDFACGTLCECLGAHPSICTVFLKGNFLTADSLPALRNLVKVFLERAEKSPSPVAAVKRRNDETEFEIRIDCGPGIFDSAVAELAVIRRTSGKKEEVAAVAAPPSAMSGASEVTNPKEITDADYHTDKKHSAPFLKEMRRLQRRLQQESLYATRLNRKLRVNNDQWLNLGVYLSSTFSEFPDEAQLIHRRIFPLLNYRLRKHRVQLVPVMLHTMSDEDFRITNTFAADGPLPINERRLPNWRKAPSAHQAERGLAVGEESNVVWSATSAEVSELRELAVRDGCDIFVGLYSDMFNPSCHVVDWNALQTSADAASIPTLAYFRKVHNVPFGLQHLFDYKASLQLDIAEKNNHPSHGNGPMPKLADQVAERKIRMNEFAMFVRKVTDKVPASMKHTYHANFSKVDANGVPRFNLDTSFFETLSQDLFAAALAYRQKRVSGSAPPPTIIPLNFDVPTIPKQNWRTGDVKANPFAHLEHKLGMDDPERNKEPFFSKDLSETILKQKPVAAPSRQHNHSHHNGPPPADTDEDAPPGSVFQCIYGQRGMGRTFQLRAVGSRIIESQNKNANIVISHSVCQGKRTLHGVMTGLLRQVVPLPAPSIADWPSLDDEDQLCKSFCDTLATRATLIPRFTKCLWILIDDDDAVEFGSSFAEAFHSKERRAMLHKAIPHVGMHVRVIFTSNIRPAPHEELTVHQCPTFDEIEAADLFVNMMLGIDNVPEATLQQVKHAAHYLVLQKKHGIKPLYLYLCAKEVLQFNEEVSMVNIAEVLPGTVEELLAVNIRQMMPRDLTSVFEAVTQAPAPLDGAFMRHAISPCRRDPAFSPVSAKRSWLTKRRWGEFYLPSLSSSPLLMCFLVNFLHLFQNCTRSRNRGWLTQRRSNFNGSIWRQEFVFLSRTIQEALSTRPKERRAKGPIVVQSENSAIPPNIWQNVLLRTSLLRDGAMTLRSLANAFDPLKFFSSPHRVFLMLHNRRYDDIRLVVERMLLLLCGPPAENSGDPSRFGIDGSLRITPQQLRAKLNELRISQQFTANDPDIALRETAKNPMGVLVEYMLYIMENWAILCRHSAFLYSCPQYAPPLIRSELERALIKENPCAYIRQDTCFSFSKKCFETALLLTSHAQEQQSSALSSSKSTITSSPTKDGGDGGAAREGEAGGPRIKTFLKASVVSKSFVVTYRSITDAKPHEITPLMASPMTRLAPEDDENGGQSFGYVGCILLLSESSAKTTTDYGFTANKNAAQQPLSKGTYFLSIRAHTNAISALDIIETKYAIRFASAAFFDNEIAIAALVISHSTPDASRLQLVGRLTMENVQRPMVSMIAMSPISKAQVTEQGHDDGQRCPMTCVAVKNYLHVFEGQRFGHDNLYNRKGVHSGQVFSGHDNRIVAYGFSPAGAKIFSIDISGHCFVWGSPESPVCGTILGVTNFGTSPSYARFVDHETLLVITNRGLLLWNSANSQLQQLLANPTRTPLEGNFAMLHYQPPAYVYGSLDDTELLQLPPHVKVHRLLEQLREKKHPTVTYMAYDGITVFDASEKQIKVFRRQHIPPQNELDCDKPPVLLFSKEASHSCTIPSQVSSSDIVGNKDVDQWKWFLGSKLAAGIDVKENVVKIFDLLKGEQVPLFFCVRGTQSTKGGPLFEALEEVALGGEIEERIVVAQNDGSIHVATLVRGPFTYPTPPFTTA